MSYTLCVEGNMSSLTVLLPRSCAMPWPSAICPRRLLRMPVLSLSRSDEGDAASIAGRLTSFRRPTGPRPGSWLRSCATP